MQLICKKRCKLFYVNVFSCIRSGSKTPASVTISKSSTLPPNLSGHVSFDARQPLAPARPRCNSILHLFGAWLFDAALARVCLHASHKEMADKGNYLTN